MKKTSTLLLAGALTFSAPIAMADDSPHEFSANVALTTDYVFRGVSQSNQQPAIQGGFDYAYSAAPASPYAGVWASNVEFASGSTDESTIEIDFYAGLNGELGGTGIGWDIGGLYYFYPGNEDEPDNDYVEAYGSLGYTFEGVTFEPSVTAFAAYSPDYFGEDDDSIYVSGELGLSLPYGFGLTALVGNIDVDGEKLTPGGFDYTHWSVGLSRDIGIFTLDATFYDSPDENDADGCGGSLCDDLFVFSISSSF